MALSENRRQFLKFLALSPAVAMAQSTRKWAGLGGGPISSPDHAINVFDFETVAEQVLPPAHWGYLQTGSDDNGTLNANREGFKQYHLRPRRLVDVRSIDMSTTLFGQKYSSPIVLSPTGRTGAFLPEGELHVARAAKSQDHLYMVSSTTGTGVEDIAAARQGPVWYQLYARYNWEITSSWVRRAEAAGCTAIVFTVDLQAGSNRETANLGAKLDKRDCASCHPTTHEDYVKSKPMLDGLENVPLLGDYSKSPDWEFIDRLREITKGKLLIKGIVRGDDAELALRHGVDGVVVSNHGGRAEDSGRGTIECLPEIVDAVGGRMTIIVDGGFRRGTDIYKALALGADAIGIGRPYLWGLSSFGQEGVEAVLKILRAELAMVMRQSGTTSIAQINSSYISKRLF